MLAVSAFAALVAVGAASGCGSSEPSRDAFIAEMRTTLGSDLAEGASLDDVDPDDLRTVLAKAIAHDGPTLVDIHSQALSEAAAPVSEWVA